jgi:hypothetical protein
MAQLYAGARKILVLDPHLQLLPDEVLTEYPNFFRLM